MVLIRCNVYENNTHSYEFCQKVEKIANFDLKNKDFSISQCVANLRILKIILLFKIPGIKRNMVMQQKWT